MDARMKLVMTGIDGYSNGESFEVKEGRTKVVGRSRSCDISLRRLTSWMEAGEEEREGAEEFKTVSRRHLKVEVLRKEDGSISVKLADLSRNGTFVDEDRIEAVSEINDWEESHYLRLGEKEKYKLEIIEDDDPDSEDVPPPAVDEEDDEEGDDEEGGTGREEKVEESE